LSIFIIQTVSQQLDCADIRKASEQKTVGPLGKFLNGIKGQRRLLFAPSVDKASGSQTKKRFGGLKLLDCVLFRSFKEYKRPERYLLVEV
jgi:hypothetical protein